MVVVVGLQGEVGVGQPAGEGGGSAGAGELSVGRRPLVLLERRARCGKGGGGGLGGGVWACGGDGGGGGGPVGLRGTVGETISNRLGSRRQPEIRFLMGEYFGKIRVTSKKVLVSAQDLTRMYHSRIEW